MEGISFAPGERGGIPDRDYTVGDFVRDTIEGSKGPVLKPGPLYNIFVKKGSPLAYDAPSSFCLGAEKIICGAFDPKGLPGKICNTVTDLTCLWLGVMVLLVLLGLSFNALLRG